MAWIKLDDGLHGNRKIGRAWRCRPALGLHLMALSYCGQYLTDGRVDVEFVEQKLPQKRERERTVAALVSSGLWREHPDDGWEIHDWLDYNKAKSQIQEERRKDSERKKLGIQKASSPPRARAGADTRRSGRVRDISVEVQNVQRIFSELNLEIDESSVLNALKRGRDVDGLDHEDLARKCAEWCRTNDRPPAPTFHTFIDRDLQRLAEQRERDKDKPRALSMVPSSATCRAEGCDERPDQGDTFCRSHRDEILNQLTGGAA